MKVIELLNESLVDKPYKHGNSVVYISRIFSDIVDLIQLEPEVFEKEMPWVDFLEDAEIVYDKDDIDRYAEIYAQYIAKRAKQELGGT